MQIRQWKIDRVKPYDRNPRRNDEAVDKVAASIQEFGFRQPIVVDSDGVIVVGHTRYKAAVKLGFEKVPVHVASELTPEKIKAYRIIDNKTNEIAEWDSDLLKMELGDLAAVEYSFDDLGFDMELDFFDDGDDDDGEDDEGGDKEYKEGDAPLGRDNSELSRVTVFIADDAREVLFSALSDLIDKLGNDRISYKV